MKQSIVKLPGQISEAELAGLRAHSVAIRLNNTAELRGELFLAGDEDIAASLQAERRFLPFRGLDGRLLSISKDMIAEIEETLH